MIVARRHHTLSWYMVAFGLSLMVAVLFNSLEASAAYQPGSNFHYLVSRGSTNQILSSQVTVYYPGDIRSSGGTRAILVRTDACFRNGAGGTMTGGTRVLTATAGGVSATWTGRQCTSHTVRTLNVPASQFTYMSDINMSYVNLTASTSDSYPDGYTLKLIGFRVDPGTGTGGIVAQRAGQVTGYRGYENSRDNGDFHDMSIPFAPACSASSSGSGRITVYDPDQDHYPQTANGPNSQLAERNWRKIDFWVEDGGGRLSRSEYTRVSNNMTWRSSPGMWRPNPSRDRSDVWVEADFSSTDNYELHIQNINTINGISVQLPYDEIYGRVDCVPTVEEDYSLTPRISVEPTVVAQPSDVSVTPTVGYSGSRTSDSAQWRISRFMLASGVASPALSTASSSNDLEPCAYITNEMSNSCSNWRNGSRAFNGTVDLVAQNDNISGLSIGQKVCYVLSVNRPTQSATPSWRHSAPVCVSVSQVPRVEIRGNDARVGSGFINTNSSLGSTIGGVFIGPPASRTGSWSEYSLIAPGRITSFGSGGGIGNGLTFSNASANNLGQFTSSASSLGTIPDIEGYLSRIGQVNLNRPLPEQYNNSVFVYDGDITISRNIQRSTLDLPGSTQMVIIANDIDIDPSVTRIDAWLVARSTLRTCSVNGNLSTMVCNQPLRINGAIMASHLQLRRTGGDSTTPAETLNLPGDAYIWMHEVSERSGSLRTTYTRELPPRY